MAVDVIVKCSGVKNSETQAAEELQRIFQETLDDSVKGTIVIVPNSLIFGTATNEIDMLVMGNIDNCKESFMVPQKNGDGYEKKIVDVRQFCTLVELKRHTIDSITREGTDYWVEYKEGPKNASDQSFKQKLAYKKFFESRKNWPKPYVTNLIWFSGINDEEFKSLNPPSENNVITGDVNAHAFFQRVIWQSILYNSTLFADFNNDFDKVVSYFDSQIGVGVLTRKKIELITSDKVDIVTPDGENLIYYNGNAGTGKTIGLIRNAVNLVNDEAARVVMLTYNRPLMYDIRRLLSLAGMSDERSIFVNTVHSFFLDIVLAMKETDKLDDYLDNYQGYIDELVEFLKIDDETKDLINNSLGKNSKLKWDYCLIDEGQDLSEKEMEALLLLFPTGKLIVADGNNQFVRDIEGAERCDWRYVESRNTKKLKYCLRQKKNLIDFVNGVAGEFDLSCIIKKSSATLSGGNVIICKDDPENYSIVKSELDKMLTMDNEKYDMITFITKGKTSDYGFIDKDEYDRFGIDFIDGTLKENKLEYTPEIDKTRLFNYKSGRGLEGWTVVCINLDYYIQINSKEAKKKYNDKALDSSLLQTEEEFIAKYLENWLMLPLTRAIDTLVITLHDYDNKYAKKILKVAREYPDFVTIKD